MVIYKLRKNDGKIASYNYYPETEKSDPGIINVDVDTRKFTTEKKSDDDSVLGTYESYAKIAILKKLKANNTPPEQGVFTWY